MKTKVIGIVASLIIHAIILGAYFSHFELTKRPLESKTKAVATISLSMFEAPQAKPVPSVSEPTEPAKPQVKPAPPKVVRTKEPNKVLPPGEKPNPVRQRTNVPKSQLSDSEKAVSAKAEKVSPTPLATPVQKPVQPVIAKKEEGLSDAERKGLENQYKNAVRQAILENRAYPRQARRKRQQGTVVVAFRLQNNGVLENLRVITSSGIEQLDKAALQAVDKVRQFAPFPKDVTRRYWDFEIPVSFKLS